MSDGDERPSSPPTFEQSTSSRTIYILERKAFGREPITNRAPLLRCAGSPQSPSPPTMGTHLERVRCSLPAVSSATQADYYEPPKTANNLKKLAPQLAAFLEEIESESAEIWMQRSTRNLTQRPKSSGMWSPVSSFHGIRHRAPHARGYNS